MQDMLQTIISGSWSGPTVRVEAGPGSVPAGVFLDSRGNLSAGKERVILRHSPGLLTVVFPGAPGRDMAPPELPR